MIVLLRKQVYSESILFLVITLNSIGLLATSKTGRQLLFQEYMQFLLHNNFLILFNNNLVISGLLGWGVRFKRRRILAQAPLGTWLGLGTEPHYLAPGDFGVKNHQYAMIKTGLARLSLWQYLKDGLGSQVTFTKRIFC